jgi:hypothetical protein
MQRMMKTDPTFRDIELDNCISSACKIDFVKNNRRVSVPVTSVVVRHRTDQQDVVDDGGNGGNQFSGGG